MTKGILVNYEYCTGCHSCEVACKKILDLPKGEFGIKVCEVGPFEYSKGEGKAKDRWEWTYMPVITKACDLCADRVSEGKDPACVHHCLAACMELVPVEEIPQKMIEHGKKVTCFIP